MEQKIQRDGGAEHFGQVAGHDGDFAKKPEREVDGSGVGFAASLGEIASGDDSEARAQSLEQDRHGVRHDQHPKQPVAELRAAQEVGRPVAGVHVTDADDVGGAGEGEHAPPDGGMVGENGVVHVRERPGVQYRASRSALGQVVPQVLNCNAGGAACLAWDSPNEDSA